MILSIDVGYKISGLVIADIHSLERDLHLFINNKNDLAQGFKDYREFFNTLLSMYDINHVIMDGTYIKHSGNFSKAALFGVKAILLSLIKDETGWEEISMMSVYSKFGIRKGDKNGIINFIGNYINNDEVNIWNGSNLAYRKKFNEIDNKYKSHIADAFSFYLLKKIEMRGYEKASQNKEQLRLY